jgi:hypothetical protein
MPANYLTPKIKHDFSELPAVATVDIMAEMGDCSFSIPVGPQIASLGAWL